MELLVPEYVQKVLCALHSAGWQAYLVGGCVRDSLLDKVPSDWDIAAESEPLQTKKALSAFHCIETGLQHGTITAVSDGHPVEVTTFRIDGNYSDNRRPDGVTFTRSLVEDLRRRDFTITAMAWQGGDLVDLFAGQADLQNGVVRCVGEPKVRFAEDGLRILRALRFASVLDFKVEESTAQAVHRQRGLLRNIAFERISVELTKFLCGPGAGRILAEFSDVLFTVIPELAAQKGCLQRGPYHLYDVWGHTLHAVEAAPPKPELRLAMLLHDIGKPACRTTDEKGMDHFYRHEEVGAEMAQQVLRRLRFSGKQSHVVCEGIRRHMLFLAPDEKLLKRRLRQFGPDFCFFLLEMQRADTRAQAPAVFGRLRELNHTEALLKKIVAEQACFSRAQLAVSGNDLLALGLQGPAVGRALGWMLDAVIAGRCQNEKQALLQCWKQQAEAPDKLKNE
ncbi:MAG: HD domain-containing protein [Oscillospiraceae bacterium]|nr:HD domain-containing protein [Oscillospiraceae bacterium]